MDDPLIYARVVHFVATILAAGVAFFAVFIAEPAFASAKADAEVAAVLRPRLRAIGWLSLGLAVLSGAAWLILTAAEMSGEPVRDVLAGGVLSTVLTQTDFGNDWLLRLAAACLLAAAFGPMLSARPTKSAPLATATLLLAAIFVGSLAWSGHGAGGLGAEAVLHPAADVLHLIAAAAWAGALIPLALLLSAAANDEHGLAVARAATVRFSTLGIVSVALLLISGIVNSWYLVGTVAALLDTDYGRLLTAKIAVFLGMVAIAAVNRLWLTPQIVAEAHAAEVQRAVWQLRRNAVFETMAGAAVIGIVAVLGTMAPASHAAHHHDAAYTSVVPPDAAFVHIHSDQGMAEVTIEPGRIGTARATVRLWTEDFAPLPAQHLTLTLAPPGPGAAAIKRAATEDADQAWQVDGITLPQAGNWTATVDVVLGSDKHLTLSAPIVIESGR